MRRFFLITSLLVAQLISAQTVFIPDPQFRSVLNEWAYGSVDEDGYLSLDMITDSAFAIPLTWSPVDLTGLEYLPLVGLDLIFEVENISFSTPVELPPGLRGYRWFGPANAPASLTLPEGLVHFSLYEAPAINWLPELPSSLKYLEVINSGLVTLEVPPLDSLESVDVYSNSQLGSVVLGSTGSLASAFIVQCSELISIAIGENYNDIMIQQNPSLVTISSLPSEAGWFQLTDLPNLTVLEADIPDNLGYLFINETGLECLRRIPNHVDFMDVENNVFNCLPNYPEVFQDIYPAIGICDILTSYCPNADPLIQGKVFRDLNGNGLMDGLEIPLVNRTLRSQPTGYMTATDETGTYIMRLPVGQHSVHLVDPGPLAVDISPLEHLADFSELGQQLIDRDFAVTVTGDQSDLEVFSVWAEVIRPGFETSVNLIVLNNGADVPNVDLQFHVPNNLNLLSCSTEPVIQGEDLHWQIGPMTFGAANMITCRFILSTSVPAGEEITTSATVLPLEDDDPSNNHSIRTETVVASYDPNDKQVFPSTFTPEEGVTGREVEYLIRFQNTGTYLAERVLITDTLSTDLIPQSLQFVGSSHPCTWFYREGALHILFEEIMLPDSTSDEPGSHGFALFRIDTRDQLLVGDQISNIANIYFDFNQPVITEPAVLTVVLPTSIAEDANEDPHVYPVPTTGLVNFSHDGLWIGEEIVIVDGKGSVIIRSRITDLNQVIDVSSLARGVYSISVGSAGKQWVGRLMVE